MIQTDVLVIGGGILGCAAAYYLAKRGVSVALVDKGPLASEATGATTAGLTLQNRSPERFPFYCAAAERWPSLSDELGADLGYNRCGSITVANTPDEFTCLQGEARGLRALGLEIELLGPTEAKKLAPWLTDNLAGVSYCPVDAFTEPNLPAPAFAAAAERQGAALLPHHPVEALQLEDKQSFRATTPQGDISAHRVVNAAGAWAGRIAAMLGVTLPISLEPLQAMTTQATTPWLDKVVLHTNRKLTLKQNQNGRIMIGGGWIAQGDLDGGLQGLLPQNRAANLQIACGAVPKLAELQVEHSWVGLEGRSPDRLPFFGQVKAVPGFFMLACVHGGFTLAPLLGDQLAELMLTGKTSFPMRPFTCREFLATVAL
ncbi:MAG: FAD-binding oxidoreductase [Anaerolineae bacterium]